MKKRMLKQIGVIAMSAVLAMPTTGVYAQEVQSKDQVNCGEVDVQKENATGWNNPAENVIELPLTNDWVDGTVDEDNPYHYDVIFANYEITVPRDGYVTVSISDPDDALGFKIYNKENKTCYCKEESKKTKTIALGKGTYYVGVYCTFGCDLWTGDYSIQASFEEVDIEDAENHDGLNSAKMIETEPVQGFLTCDSNTDYYCFQTYPFTGLHEIVLRTEVTNDLQMELMDDNGEMIECETIRKKDSQNKYIYKLVNGNAYYIKLSPAKENSYVTGEYSIIIKSLVSGIQLEKEKIELSVGAKARVNAWITDLTVDNDALEWSGSGKIVDVTKEGIIKAKQPGVAKICVKTVDDSDIEKYVTVVVKPKQTSGLKLKQVNETIKASWNAQAGISKYEMQYSTNANFSKKTTKKIAKTSAQINAKNMNNKTCYVRVRAYFNDTNTGKNYYGKWSAAKKIKIKVTIQYPLSKDELRMT
ncbi:MAG: Ig domain-containing protein [Lachnospiraceae bacterium]